MYVHYLQQLIIGWALSELKAAHLGGMLNPDEAAARHLNSKHGFKPGQVLDHIAML